MVFSATMEWSHHIQISGASVMRVGIVALLHESNTFIKEPTRAAHFESDLLLVGEPLVDMLLETHHEVGGFLTALKEEGLEIVPLVATRAVPFGPISSET